MNMKISTIFKMVATAFLLLVGLLGCGSDESGSPLRGPAGSIDTNVIGVAATGAPMAGDPAMLAEVFKRGFAWRAAGAGGAESDLPPLYPFKLH